MTTQAHKLGSLRREKITFTLIICILLFSLIYISTSTLLLKNENLKFSTAVASTQREINTLLNVEIPVKDSVITQQKTELQKQAYQIEQALMQTQISADEREKLKVKLQSLRRQAGKLRERIKTAENEQKRQADRLLMARTDRKDSLLQMYQKEVTVLRRKVAGLESAYDQQKEETQAVASIKPVVKEKVSTVYFSARPDDRKNRASKSSLVFIQMQLKGDINTMRCRSLQVEIRDPENHIITDQQDRIRISAEYKTEYIFKPLRNTLVRGKYSIRVFCEGSDFQHIDFFTLV
jgi:hypothetical protein